MFADRADAGVRLAAKLEHLRGADVVVVGLPRGGVPVASEVARALDAPLDIILVRKLGLPLQPELAIGAIGESGVRVLNDEVLGMAHVSDEDLERVERSERLELERRIRRYRSGTERIPLEGRVAVVVDDGIATGSTAQAACRIARLDGASRVVLAVPVAPAGWTDRLGGQADELIAVETPEYFIAIGQFYRDFSQVTDDEVVAILDGARSSQSNRSAETSPNRARETTREDVEIPIDPHAPAGRALKGHLSIPPQAKGVVVFAHGSGSSRHSPRNRYVAEVLTDAGLATVLFDLLTEEEELDRSRVFDIDLLAGRLVGATDWVRRHPHLAQLPIGYFGASTGAAAALWAATDPGFEVAAVVSRGGWPDLAEPRLSKVTVPTLFIVGERDVAVLDLNRRAERQLGGRKRIEVVPGATHLFEETGALQAAAEAARDWFVANLSTIEADTGTAPGGSP